jgi:hypothetical protein
MPEHRRQIAVNIAAEFLKRSFVPGETIAILLRRSSPAVALQRIVTLECALANRYLGWLASENATGANVYIGANPLRAGSKKRTKESVAAVRHLYLDLDTDGSPKLAALMSSKLVPAPTAIISTSYGKFQVLWCVDGFTFPLQESVLKVLAFTFGGDPACTDCNRVLRLPGFLNHKYDPAHPVSVHFLNSCTSNPAKFGMDLAAHERTQLPQPISPRSVPEKRTNSEHDWAWVLRELARGMDARKLTRTLAERRSDKPDPLYYAQRTVDVASAWLWLSEGAPIADVVTMLEVHRRFEIPHALCVARAQEIALTVERMIVRTKIA